MLSDVMYLNKNNGTVYPLEISKYPSGEPLIKNFEIGERPSAVLIRTAILEKFVSTMFWIDALAARGETIPQLILPFVPGARQDRLNSSGDYLFTAKSIAQMINARNFPSVTVVDPHSEVTTALIDRCKVIHAADIVFRSIFSLCSHGYKGIIAPDGGAEKRAAKVATILKLPLYHAWKTRDISTGNISGFGFEDLDSGGRFLLVDDICDGGGTFNGLAEAIYNQPKDVELDLFVTHGIFSQGFSKLFDNFTNIYTTDSLKQEGNIDSIKTPINYPDKSRRERFEVIPICENLIRGF